MLLGPDNNELVGFELMPREMWTSSINKANGLDNDNIFDFRNCYNGVLVCGIRPVRMISFDSFNPRYSIMIYLVSRFNRITLLYARQPGAKDSP